MAHYLSEHPDIHFSVPKEPHFFATDMLGYQRVKIVSDYNALFSNDAKMNGEGSVWYLHSEVALRNIHDYNPEAKIIIMLRNPVEMVVSAHSQLLFSANENVSTFSDAWDLIEQRKRGMQLPRLNTSPRTLFYDEIAKYSVQLERAFSIFRRENIHILFFDEFKSDTKTAYGAVLDFLELNNDERRSFEIVNANTVLRSPLLKDLARDPDSIFRKVNGTLKRMGMSFGPFMRWVDSKNEVRQHRQEVPILYKQKILESYFSDIEKLESMLSRDLSAWKSI